MDKYLFTRVVSFTGPRLARPLNSPMCVLQTDSYARTCIYLMQLTMYTHTVIHRFPCSLTFSCYIFHTDTDGTASRIHWNVMYSVHTIFYMHVYTSLLYTQYKVHVSIVMVFPFTIRVCLHLQTRIYIY